MQLHSPPQTPLTGRAQELDHLQDLVLNRTERSVDGVVLGGEAGVGKSRLVAELSTELLQRGWKVAVGHCLDFGTNAPPYIAFVEILERLAREDQARMQRATRAHPAIQRLVPGAQRRETSEGPTDGVDRVEFFTSLRSVLADMAADGPLLIVIEDLHWADNSTLEAVSYLFAQNPPAEVALVTTYRSDDLYRGHPLRARLAQWGRMRSIARVPLQPLDDDDIRSLIQVTAPHVVSEQELSPLVERAQGNAFFAEELAAAQGIGHRGVPDDLAELLLNRVDQTLSTSARELVRAASIIGRGVHHDAFRILVPLDDSALEEALREAIENHVLIPGEGDAYGFRHALMAEAVYHDLLPAERLRFHTAYAAALSEQKVAGSAAALAIHSFAARDLDTAARASVDAGRQAVSVGGADEAVRHFELALDLVERPETTIDIDIVDLTLETAEAQNTSGQAHRAAAMLDDRLRTSAGLSPKDYGRLLTGLAQACLHSDYPHADALETSARALGYLEDSVSVFHASALETHARANMAYGRFSETGQFANKALAMAKELNDARLIVAASTTLGRLKERTGDPGASILTLSHVVAKARESGDFTGVTRGLHQLTAITFGLGELTTARSHARECAHVAAASGSPWSPFGLGALIYVGLIDYMLGNWNGASESEQHSAPPPAHAQALMDTVKAQVAVGRGDQRKHQLLASLRPWWEQDGWCAVTNVGSAIDGFGDDGDIAAAITAYDEGVAAVQAAWHTERFGAQTRWIALLTGQMANNAAASTSQQRLSYLERAEDLAAILTERPEDVANYGVLIGPEGLAWQMRQQAELQRLHWLVGSETAVLDDLIATWEDVVGRFSTLGHVFEIARSQVRLASVYHAAGDLETATSLLTEAHHTSEQLGSKPLMSEISELGLLGDHSPPVQVRNAPALTHREEDVLKLVANGRSNGQIAQQLFISPKTVSVHVSNILAKLGAASRTEAATIAHRDGLLSS